MGNPILIIGCEEGAGFEFAKKNGGISSLSGAREELWINTPVYVSNSLWKLEKNTGFLKLHIPQNLPASARSDETREGRGLSVCLKLGSGGGLSHRGLSRQKR